MTERFYLDHGLWHDRETGQHMYTQDQYDECRRDWYRAGVEDERDGIAWVMLGEKPNEE